MSNNPFFGPRRRFLEEFILPQFISNNANNELYVPRGKNIVLF